MLPLLSTLCFESEFAHLIPPAGTNRGNDYPGEAIAVVDQ